MLDCIFANGNIWLVAKHTDFVHHSSAGIHLLNRGKKLEPQADEDFILFLSILILVLLFYALSSMVIDKINMLKNDQIYLRNILYKLQHLIPVGSNIEKIIEDGLKSVGSWAAGLFPSLISGVLHIVLGLLLMYFLLYFMLVEREAFENALLKYALSGSKMHIALRKKYEIQLTPM